MNVMNVYIMTIYYINTIIWITFSTIKTISILIYFCLLIPTNSRSYLESMPTVQSNISRNCSSIQMIVLLEQMAMQILITIALIT